MDINASIAIAAAEIAKLKNRLTELQKSASELDKEVSHHYHVLELVPMNAVQLAIVTKSLRNVLKTRREAKENSALLQSVLSGKTLDLRESPTKIAEREAVVSRYVAEAQESFAKIMGNRLTV